MTSAVDVSIVTGIACLQLHWTVEGRGGMATLLRMLTSLLEHACCWSREDVCVRKGLPCTHAVSLCMQCPRLLTTAVTLTAWVDFLFSKLSPREKSVSFQIGKSLITASVFAGHHLLCSGYKNPKLKCLHSPNQIEHNRK